MIKNRYQFGFALMCLLVNVGGLLHGPVGWENLIQLAGMFGSVMWMAECIEVSA